MLLLRLLAEGGEGPNTELLFILWVLLGFFALAVVVGWAAGLRKPKQAPARAEPSLSLSRKRPADDLTRIEGIGPKAAKVLERDGIATFEELAGSKAADVQALLNKAGMHMMSPDGWIDQAKLAAKGDWSALEKMQRKLKGGRRAK